MFRAIRLASTCRPTIEIYREGMSLQVYKHGAHPTQLPTRFTLMGIAPDGVDAISATVDKRNRKIPVVSNGFMAEANAPIEIVALSR